MFLTLSFISWICIDTLHERLEEKRNAYSPKKKRVSGIGRKKARHSSVPYDKYDVLTVRKSA